MEPEATSTPTADANAKTEHVRPFVASFLGEEPYERPKMSSPAHVTANDSSKVFVGVAQTTSTFNAPVEHVHNYYYGDHGNGGLQESNAMAVLSWLSPPDQMEPYLAALAKLEEDTGQWLLQSTAVQQWLVEQHSLLWLHGGVGTGKTILCSAVIKITQQYGKEDSARKECFFFFSSQEASRRSLLPLQKSLIAQLSTVTSIIEPLQLLHSECHKTYPDRKPTQSELRDVITKTLKAANEDVFVFIDALDEVPFEEREDVTSFLAVLANLKLPKLHLFVTSRNEPDIEQALSYPIRWAEKAMDEEAVNSDINLYVSRFLENSARFRNQESRTKDSIRKRLVAQGGSMFRWAALQLAMLSRLRVINHGTIEIALSQLPKDLNETYVRLLTEIEPDMIDKARRALLWLTVSIRPLYIEEITEACSVRLEGHADFERSRISPYNLYQILRDLISIVPRITETEPVVDSCHVVRLAHASVREFLMSQHITSSPAGSFFVDMQHAHEFVAQRCISYLYQYNSHGRRRARYPLRQYCWYNWESHIFPDAPRASTGNTIRHLAVGVFNGLMGELPTEDESRPATFESYENDITFAQVQSALRMVTLLRLSDMERLKDALRWPYFFPDFDSYESRSALDQPKATDPAIPEHQYTPLADSKIRLLRVLPCLDRRQAILAVFWHADLTRRPAYIAVSYVWGSHWDQKKAGIICIDGRRVTRVEIMPHLLGMLQLVRSTNEKSQATLWIDSISINQSDTSEKNQQVMLMPTIFQSATEVMVYLDSDNDVRESVHNFKMLQVELILSMARVPVSTTFDQAQRLDRYRLDKLLALFEHSYWKRSWIVSELVLASTLTIFYNTVSLNFSLLEQFCDLEHILKNYFYETCQVDLVKQLDRHDGWQKVKHICLTRHEARKGVDIPLPQLIYRFASHHTAIAQDRIYAIVPLASRASGSVVVRPDYTLTGKELVRSVTELILMSTKGLDILSYWPRFQVDAIVTTDELPSWMPRLVDVPSEVIPLSPGCFVDSQFRNIYKASNGRRAERKRDLEPDALVLAGIPVCQIVWTGQLEAEGVRIPDADMVEHVAELPSWTAAVGYESVGAMDDFMMRLNIEMVEARKALGEAQRPALENDRNNLLVLQMDVWGNITARETSTRKRRRPKGTEAEHQVYVPPNQTLVEACWRTALADQWPRGKRLRDSDGKPDGRTVPHVFKDSSGNVNHETCRIPPELAEGATQLLGRPGVLYQMSFLKGRTFFLTSNGLLGLGLDDIEVGDTVAVLYGGDVPYVVRPKPENEECWEYKGECYVHGIMDGEVVRDLAEKKGDYEERYFRLV